jgi:hypothetical protein
MSDKPDLVVSPVWTNSDLCKIKININVETSAPIRYSLIDRKTYINITEVTSDKNTVQIFATVGGQSLELHTKISGKNINQTYKLIDINIEKLQVLEKDYKHRVSVLYVPEGLKDFQESPITVSSQNFQEIKHFYESEYVPQENTSTELIEIDGKLKEYTDILACLKQELDDIRTEWKIDKSYGSDKKIKKIFLEILYKIELCNKIRKKFLRQKLICEFYCICNSEDSTSSNQQKLGISEIVSKIINSIDVHLNKMEYICEALNDELSFKFDDYLSYCERQSHLEELYTEHDEKLSKFKQTCTASQELLTKRDNVIIEWFHKL